MLGFQAIKPEQHFTEPPPRYNEATLVKRLESDGVGRPSTYASIISTILEREYVTKEGGRFTPAELGMVVTDLLLESFDDIFEVEYTARMEAELDEVEEGKLDWRVAMGEFYERFEKDLKHAEEHMTDVKRMEKPTDLICEKCGKPLVIKWGKHGSFIACTGYPDCTYTRELTVDLPDVDGADLSEQGEEEYCENCGRSPASADHCWSVRRGSVSWAQSSAPKRMTAWRAPPLCRVNLQPRSSRRVRTSLQDVRAFLFWTILVGSLGYQTSSSKSR